MSRIARLHGLPSASEFASAATLLREEILMKAVHPERNCLVADYGGREVDAALLQATSLRFLTPEDPRMLATVNAVRQDLEHQGWLRRYRTNDGFGVPNVGFTICTFWLVEALARLGHSDEARAVLARVKNIHAPLGLLSEDFDTETGIMWGNYPQAYSHVGLIHAAFAASPRWSELGG
jgi:GH15 family glucan-1,4-alpha-glucosidase